MKEIIENFENLLNELEKFINESPFKTRYIYDRMGMTKTTFYRKLKGKSFSIEEMKVLAEILEFENAHKSA